MDEGLPITTRTNHYMSALRALNYAESLPSWLTDQPQHSYYDLSKERNKVQGQAMNEFSGDISYEFDVDLHNLHPSA
jgi:hypothetical protein